MRFSGLPWPGSAGCRCKRRRRRGKALAEALELPDAGIVLITKDASRLLKGQMEALKLRSSLPLVVEIPSPEGTPEGEPSLGNSCCGPSAFGCSAGRKSCRRPD